MNREELYQAVYVDTLEKIASEIEFEKIAAARVSRGFVSGSGRKSYRPGDGRPSYRPGDGRAYPVSGVKSKKYNPNKSAATASGSAPIMDSITGAAKGAAGYAKAHPELVAAQLNACAIHQLAIVIENRP